jgi:hypothetical protein
MKQSRSMVLSMRLPQFAPMDRFHTWGLSRVLMETFMVRPRPEAS